MSRQQRDSSPEGTGAPRRAPGSLSALRVRHGREILALTTPTVLAMMSYTLMWTVDTALLGHVSSAALGGAGLGGLITWAGYCLFNNLNRISSTFVSQAHGNQDDESVGHYLWQGIYISIATGLLLQLAGYYAYLALPFTKNPPEIQFLTYTYIKWRTLSAVPTQLIFCLSGFFQGRRDVKTPMWAGVTGNLLNLVLDVCLIFGWSGIVLAGHRLLAVPALGVQGAAIATSIGSAVQVAILIVCTVAPRRHRERYRIHIPRRPDVVAFRDIAQVGLPAAWEAFIEMAAFALFSVFIGRLGAASLAASQITVQLLSFSFMPMWGLTVAGTVLTGNAIGAGRHDEAADYANQVYKVGVYYMLALAALLVLAGRFIYSVFTDDPEVLALGATLAVIAALFQIGDGMRMLSVGVLSGAGDTLVPMLIGLAVMWGGFIPLSYALVVVGSGSVAAAWHGGAVCYAVQALLLYLRFRSGNWRRIHIFSER
jgi:MATE family multidrug resistance protein